MRNLNESSRQKPLNIRARKLLLFVHEFKEQNDYSPSNRDIGEAVDISSTSVVRYYILMLQKIALLDFVPGQSRTLHLTPDGKQQVMDWLRVEKPEVLHRRVTDKIKA